MTAEIKPEHDGNALSAVERSLHFTAALGAALVSLTPYLQTWIVTAFGVPLSFRSQPGHLLIDGLQGLAVILGGVMAGGWWWWTAGTRSGFIGILGAMLLLAFGTAGVIGLIPLAAWLAFITVWLAWGVASACSRPRLRRRGLREFLRQRRHWNAIFFMLFIVLGLACDALLLRTSPRGALAAAAFLSGRAALYLILASALWLLLLFYQRWAPLGLRWLGWAGISLLPLLFALDTAMRLMWRKSLMQLCAELNEDGRVNVLQQLEGGGVELSASRILNVLLCLAAAVIFFATCGWISRRAGWRTSATGLLRTGLGAWVFLLVVQTAEHAFTATEWRHWRDRTCLLQLSPFHSEPGLASFDVQFSNPVLQGKTPVARKPEIFLFIIETLRADALRPDVAPFLTKWRDTECQQLGDTRSASNATHLSWFSILHGRLPLFLDDARRAGAPPTMLTLFRNAGWRVEVRDAGTFDYHDMLLVNFDGGKSVDHLEHVPLGHLDRRFEVSEREVKMFSRFREAVIAAPAQGTFWLTGIDSTHYPYKWGRDWKPPITGFVENPIFPPLPSEEEIESVRKRYWNSVAWDDHLFGDFITFLRSTGRYDDAIIVVTGDHGEEFKEHGSWFHCSGVNREQTNVPLLIKWPASWGRGPALADASHLDIAPTLLDAAGFPREIWSGLPGRSLRDAKAATSIVATNYSGESREAMLWRRDGYEAAFSWESPWLEQVPGRIWLQRLEGPAGQIRCETPEGYEAKLRELFPDAFARVASSFTPVASDVTKVPSDRLH